jgi:hypothetical protein
MRFNMALRFPNMILPGEVLNAGESLISLDGRFRLSLLNDGSLIAFAYTLGTGIKRFYVFPIAGEGATLTLGRANRPQFPAPRDSFPAVLLKNRNGLLVWNSPSYGVSAPVFENHRFEMQSDGNIVHYAKYTTTGDVTYGWAPGTDNIFREATAIPPNTTVATIAGQISLINAAGAGNVAIVNDGIGMVGVYAGGVDVLSIPQGGEISAVLSGTIAIQTDSYWWNDLHAADGTRPRKDALDALPNVPRPNSGERNRIYIGKGGSLRGDFHSDLGRLQVRSITGLQNEIGQRASFNDCETGAAEPSGEPEPPMTPVLKS